MNFSVEKNKLKNLSITTEFKKNNFLTITLILDTLLFNITELL